MKKFFLAALAVGLTLFAAVPAAPQAPTVRTVVLGSTRPSPQGGAGGGSPGPICWVNFRATASPIAPFPGDSACSTYNLGEFESTTGARPINGIYTQGFGASWPGFYLGNNGYNSSEHQYGYSGTGSSVQNQAFHIGLLTPGLKYRIRISMANWDVSTGSGVAVTDGVTTKCDQPGGSLGSDRNMMDMAGTVHTTVASWTAAIPTAYCEFTAATADLYFIRGSTGNTLYVTAIGIQVVP